MKQFTLGNLAPGQLALARCASANVTLANVVLGHCVSWILLGILGEAHGGNGVGGRRSGADTLDVKRQAL